MSYALQFDGVNDYVSMPALWFPSVVTDFAVEYRVRWTTAANHVVFDNGRYDDGIYSNLSSGNITFYINKQDLTTSGASFNDGDWHKVRYVQSGSSGSIYVDDVLRAGPTVLSTPAPTGAFVIGHPTHAPTVAKFDGDFEYLSLEDPNDANNSFFWDARSTSTGSALPETTGNGSDGTLQLFPTDDSQWIDLGGGGVSVGLAAEADTALPVSISKTVAIGLASEADTALPVAPHKAVSVGIATEADSALFVTPYKAAPVGIASEVDSALSITAQVGSNVTVSVGIASETDTAQSISPYKVASVGTASEIDEALSVSPGKGYPVNQASESDTALTVTPYKVVSVGIAVESNTALPVTLIGGIPVAPDIPAARGGGASGAKLHPEDNSKRRKEIERLYAELIDGEQPEEVREAAAEVVKPYSRGRAEVPKPASVQWKPLLQRAESIERLLTIHARLREIEAGQLEEEAILLLVA